MKKSSVLINILSKLSVVFMLSVLGSYVFQVCSFENNINWKNYKQLILIGLIALGVTYAARIIDILIESKKR